MELPKMFKKVVPSVVIKKWKTEYIWDQRLTLIDSDD